MTVISEFFSDDDRRFATVHHTKETGFFVTFMAKDQDPVIRRYLRGESAEMAAEDFVMGYYGT